MTILTFFTKILSRSAQWRSCFAFTFLCEREAGLNINKVCDFVLNEKNNIFISCVLNGFKYNMLSNKIQMTLTDHWLKYNTMSNVTTLTNSTKFNIILNAANCYCLFYHKIV